ncbi:MAG: phage baseplate assembly protein V [Rhodobiaceae bacterium]|nr:phage baseplate assembly protein V [Rhodobiaceae bacterium]
MSAPRDSSAALERHQVRKLVRRIADLEALIEQMDRRINNLMREGKVLETDFEKGLVKIDAGDLGTDWVPWMERAGSIRTWMPPEVGERVVLFSPSGEPGQGFVAMGGYSSEFGQPHQEGSEHVETIGAMRALWTADGLHLTGNLRVDGDTLLNGGVDLGGEGGEPAGLEGSIDDAGHALVSALSTKVRIVR